MNEKIYKFITIIIIILIIYIGLITLPISSTKEDIFFEVTITNNILNQPKITNVVTYTKPATILPSTFVMASLIQSDELQLQTKVGSNTVTKNIGKLDIINTVITNNEKTVYYRVPGILISSHIEYKIYLLENGKYIDTVDGVI